MVGSITQKARGFTRWLGQQVVDNDFGSGDERTRDYALVGATAGAVAGATAGTIAGFKAQSTNDVNEVWVDRTIDHPKMSGYSHIAVPDYSTDCTTDYDGNEQCTTELEGWWHHYTPNIYNRVVGGFQEPTFQNSNFLEPLMGGLLGAVGGGAIGLAAGIGAAALQRSLETKSGQTTQPVRLEPEAKSALTERAGIAVAAGTAVGAGLGVFLGGRAGQVELGAQEVHNRTWSVPVTETETLGHVPSSHYEWNWSGFPLPLGGDRPATVPVQRQVPVYDRAGEPRLTHTSKTFTTNRYGPLFGGIAGGLMGAGVGLAAGVAVGITDKMLSERSARVEAA